MKKSKNVTLIMVPLMYLDVEKTWMRDREIEMGNGEAIKIMKRKREEE